MSKPQTIAQKPKTTTNAANPKKKASPAETSTKSTPASKSRVVVQAPSKRKDDPDPRRSLNGPEKIPRNPPAVTKQAAPAVRTKTQTSQVTPRSTGAINKKLGPQTSNTTDSPRNRPIKAQHHIATQKTNNVQATTKTVHAAKKPNAVLDSYHNVTVASPPSQRKEVAVGNVVETAAALRDAEKAKLVRKRSRTLEPDEIVVLKRESAKKRSEQEILVGQRGGDQEPTQKLPIREAVAFEVKLKEDEPAQRERSRTRAGGGGGESDNGNYSDDFESYESDFETGSSSRTGESSSETEETTPTSSSEEEEEEEATSSASASSKEQDEPEEEDDSELTQYPITVIPQRDKERKLDSGNYEMNSRKTARLPEGAGQQQQFDSFDTFSATTASDQLDSGISTYGLLASSPADTAQTHCDDVFYGGYREFHARPIWNRRGRELMAKLQFDTLTFTLLDMKPISYEIFMRSYGQLNATQCSTQTQDNQLAAESQTEASERRTMWTQHPPQYDLQTVQRSSTRGLYLNASNCCGEDVATAEPARTLDPNRDELDESLEVLRSFRQNDKSTALQRQLSKLPKPIDFERLNAFLLNSSLLMSKVLNSSGVGAAERPTHSPDEFCAFSEGYSLLDTKILNALRVVRVFANGEHNLIVTVHESLPDAAVYRSDFSQLLMVWSSQECNKPVRLLSTWSEVSRVEICHESPDIIVCGLRDGSVAMWDMRETYTYCSKLDGHLTHFAATQSIVPHWDAGSQALDLGAVVDVKSFRKPKKTAIAGYKPIQFASLNETGILVVWTLVETQTAAASLPKTRKQSAALTRPTRFEYNSPWARVKLTQSSICSVRDYLACRIPKAPSQFDQTKGHFEKNIYSDNVLRELNDQQLLWQQQQHERLQGLRCTSIATGVELIYVCTNRNFLLCCTKSLKAERFRRIAIEESRFLFATALCVLSNEHFLAVGLSNGSVMILNCNQRQRPLANDAKRPPVKCAEPAGQPDDADHDLAMGKSCAIQNIILNERNGRQCAPQSPNEQRPSTAACIAMISSETRPFELHVYDHQVILGGSVLRKDLVQSLELSSDGWRLFALSNGTLRAYDFCLDKELRVKATANDYRIVDIAAAKGRNTAQHLLLLNAYNDVELHSLKP